MLSQSRKPGLNIRNIMNHQTTRAIVVSLITMALAHSQGDEMSIKPDPANGGTNSVRRLNPAPTREQFLQWRSPRFGAANPERMNNPVWEWLVRSKLTAYDATERMRGPSALEAGPGWCFQRFGQSSTKLPDGREVFVGGEHEDGYDPDFYVYNDVVVRHPDDRLDIFGYPRRHFPPTEFHSATLVSNGIVLIGGLRDPKDRQPGQTPVFLLDLHVFSIKSVKTEGPSPGWIHRHKASLSADGRSILVQGGEVDLASDRGSVDNIDDWRLSLADWRWERLTDRRWPQLEVRRKDGESNHLLFYQEAVLAKQFPELEKQMAAIQKQFGAPMLAEQLGGAPDLDAYEHLFQPPVPHEVVNPPEPEHDVHCIKVAGVMVRYRVGMASIRVTVEGELPATTLDALGKDLVGKFEKIERTRCELIKRP